MADTEKRSGEEVMIERSDEELGKLCRRIAIMIGEDDDREATPETAAAIFLISRAVKMNSQEMTISLEDAFEGDTNFGNWTLTIKKD